MAQLRPELHNFEIEFLHPQAWRGVMAKHRWQCLDQLSTNPELSDFEKVAHSPWLAQADLPD